MYCGEAEFAARFGSAELDQLLPSDGDRTYAAAADDADAIVDGYLAARYAVPLATPPGLILSIAADLTRYELYADAPTKEVEARRKLALDLLEQIRDGELLLPGASVSSSTPGIAVQSAPRVYDEVTTARYMGLL